MRPTIEKIRGEQDFQTIFRWNMEVIRPPSGLGNLVTDLDVLCISHEIPKKIVEPITISIRGHKVKQPGIATYSDTITLIFAETVSHKITDFIEQWSELVWSLREGKSISASAAKADIQLRLLNNSDVEVYEYLLKGCLYNDTDPGGIPDGETNDIRKPNLIMTMDYFESKKL